MSDYKVFSALCRKLSTDEVNELLELDMSIEDTIVYIQDKFGVTLGKDDETPPNRR